MKKIEINTTASVTDKKYLKNLDNAVTIMHSITGTLPFCSYDNAHSLTFEDVRKHVFTFNIIKGTAKTVSFNLNNNVDLVDGAKYNEITNAYAWFVIDSSVKSAIEKIESSWKIIEEDNRENVEEEEYIELSRRMAMFRLRANDFFGLFKSVSAKDTNDKFIRLMVFHAMNNGKERRSILEQIDKHNQLEKLYSLEFIDKEASACAIVKDCVNNLFADILDGSHDAVGIHKFRVKVDHEAKEAVTKACLHSFYEAGAASKKGYHGEVMTEATNKENICAQVVCALRRAIQRRILIENATSEVANG